MPGPPSSEVPRRLILTVYRLRSGLAIPRFDTPSPKLASCPHPQVCATKKRLRIALSLIIVPDYLIPICLDCQIQVG
jgi:hypothetical protein